MQMCGTPMSACLTKLTHYRFSFPPVEVEEKLIKFWSVSAARDTLDPQTCFQYHDSHKILDSSNHQICYSNSTADEFNLRFCLSVCLSLPLSLSLSLSHIQAGPVTVES